MCTNRGTSIRTDVIKSKMYYHHFWVVRPYMSCKRCPRQFLVGMSRDEITFARHSSRSTTLPIRKSHADGNSGPAPESMARCRGLIRKYPPTGPQSSETTALSLSDLDKIWCTASGVAGTEPHRQAYM